MGPYEQSLRESRERVAAAALQRQRSARRRRLLTIGAVVLVAGGLGFGGWKVLLNRETPTVVPTSAAAPASCTEPTAIHVAVAPAIAPAVAAAAEALSKHDDGPCAAFTIESVDAFTVSGSLTGPGQPDAWISDSPTWVARAAAISGTAFTAGPTIASAAVLVAMPEAAATRLGNSAPWAAILGGATPVRVPDPNRSAVGAASLGAASPSLSPTQTTALYARIAAGPGPTDLAGVASSTTPTGLVVPAPLLLAHNDARPEATLAAVAPADGTAPIDYALVPVSVDKVVAPLVAAFGDFLRSDEATEIFRSAGFTAGSGSDPTAPTPLYGVLKARPAPTAAVLSTIRQKWAAAAPRTQALLVLDVSGSMLERTPEGTRLSIMQQAAIRSLATIPPQSRAALWAYSSHIGTKGDDYKAVVGLGQLGDATHLKRIDEALAALTKSVGGGSGLYDTIASAYAESQRTWAPGQTNAIVLITDGPNEDDYGLSLDLLKQRLTASRLAAKPVRVTIVGIGSAPDEGAMNQVVKITGGAYIAAPEIADLASALTKALGG